MGTGKLPFAAQSLLDMAQAEPKGDYRKYGIYKRKMGDLPLSHAQYQAVHAELIRVFQI